MSKAEPGVGDLELTLGKDVIVLKPTTEACLALCRLPGGLYGQGSIVQRMLNCDIDTMVAIIRIGAGLPSSTPIIKQLEEGVFRYGLVKMRDSLSGWIGTIANGGVPPGQEGEGEGDGDPQQASA
jgi:hypothetical protein